MVGLYTQLTEFTNKNAGTSEWCFAQKNGKDWFLKKFQKPVYPPMNAEMPAEKIKTKQARFHKATENYKSIYAALKTANRSGILVVPEEVFCYQNHICTAAEKCSGNLKPELVHKLSPWQKYSLMRTLTLALMNVHDAGIVHADMKPDNIMISCDSFGNCHLRLIDFDSGYFATNPPKGKDDIGGDIAYWAPEIIEKFEDESVVMTKSIDTFALGLLLYYFWCGKLPETPEGKTNGQCVHEGKDVKIGDNDVPPALKMLIKGLTKRDPSQRLNCLQAYNVLGVQLEKSPQIKISLKEVKPAEKSVPVAEKITVTRGGSEPASEKHTVTYKSTVTTEEAYEKYVPRSEEEYRPDHSAEEHRGTWRQILPWILLLIAVVLICFWASQVEP